MSLNDPPDHMRRKLREHLNSLRCIKQTSYVYFCLDCHTFARMVYRLNAGYFFVATAEVFYFVEYLIKLELFFRHRLIQCLEGATALELLDLY